MQNLREVAQKFGLATTPISMRGLASQLGLSPPISLQNLVNHPATLTYKTGIMSAGDVSGSAELGISSSGHWSFRGRLDDKGTLVGDSYVLVIALNFVDTSGQIAVVKQEGSLGGSVFGESRNVTWQQDGYDPLIALNWNNIRDKGFTAKLEVGPDAAQIFQAVVTSIAIVIAVVAVAYVLAHIPSGGSARGMECDWRVVPRDPNDPFNQQYDAAYHCEPR
jgi:hypothetical protein